VKDKGPHYNPKQFTPEPIVISTDSQSEIRAEKERHMPRRPHIRERFKRSTNPVNSFGCRVHIGDHISTDVNGVAQPEPSGGHGQDELERAQMFGKRRASVSVGFSHLSKARLICMFGVASGMKSPMWPGDGQQSQILVYGLR
jgi:hypothetical protein